MTETVPAASRDQALRTLEDEVGVMMRRVRRVLTDRARLLHPDLQPGSYVILAHVEAHGPLRASDLRAAIGIDKAAVSRQVQHLIELGLVDRTPDPDDGRATLLSASDDGRARLATVGDERRAYLAERLEGWTDDDLAVFVDALTRYNATLTESL